jgi:hypothetical protein
MMRKLIWAVLAGLPLAACAYQPTLTETVLVVDSPTDVVGCRSLGSVSEVVPTGTGFGSPYQAMLEQTVARGGTDLLLVRRSGDWAYVRGVAYRCPGRGPWLPIKPAPSVVVRARG